MRRAVPFEGRPASLWRRRMNMREGGGGAKPAEGTPVCQNCGPEAAGGFGPPMVAPSIRAVPPDNPPHFQRDPCSARSRAEAARARRRVAALRQGAAAGCRAKARTCRSSLRAEVSVHRPLMGSFGAVGKRSRKGSAGRSFAWRRPATCRCSLLVLRKLRLRRKVALAHRSPAAGPSAPQASSLPHF